MTPAVFAKALAAALAASLPDGFTATAEGDAVTIESPDGVGSTTALNIELEEADDPDVLADAAEGVLSLAQDIVCEALDAPWPTGAASTIELPMPGARIDGGVVRLWFGDEDAPVLRLKGIRLET